MTTMGVDEFKTKVLATRDKPVKGRMLKALIERGEGLMKGGPFIGPKGGKYADAAHTIPWHEGIGMEPRRLDQWRKLGSKFDSSKKFAASNLKGYGAKSPAQVAAHIQTNSATKVDTDGIRKNLSASGDWYIHHKIAVSDVDHMTHGSVESSGKEDLSKPIVVNHKGEVIDGRHRVHLALKQGITHLPAIMPAKMFHDREVGNPLTKALGGISLPGYSVPNRSMGSGTYGFHRDETRKTKNKGRRGVSAVIDQHNFADRVKQLMGDYESKPPRVVVDLKNLDPSLFDALGKYTELHKDPWATAQGEHLDTNVKENRASTDRQLKSRFKAQEMARATARWSPDIEAD
jgi:hypothetical protein